MRPGSKAAYGRPYRPPPARTAPARWWNRCQGALAAPNDAVRKIQPQTYFYYELFVVSGCGPAEEQRLLVRREGAGWRSAALAPGQSVASIVPQQGFRLVDTRLKGGAYAPGQPWAEQWFVRACDVDYAVEVALKPAADGGTDFQVIVPKP